MTVFPKPGSVWNYERGVSYSFLYSEFGPNMVELTSNEKAPYAIEPHQHPHFEVLYITKGCRRLRLRDRDYEARAGDLILFKPGEEHAECHGSKTISFVTLRFKAERLLRSGVELPLEEAPGPVLQLGKRKRFMELFTRMLDEQRSALENSGLLLSAYLVEFFVLMRRAMQEWIARNRKSPRKISRVQAALDAIQKNLDRPPELTELARRCFLSPSHFSHVFKAEVGMSPRDYAISIRINKAKEYLAGTDMPAQEIAAVLGYDSPYFFYRQFKHKTGMTALAFRARHRTAEK